MLHVESFHTVIGDGGSLLLVGDGLEVSLGLVLALAARSVRRRCRDDLSLAGENRVHQLLLQLLLLQLDLLLLDLVPFLASDALSRSRRRRRCGHDLLLLLLL